MSKERTAKITLSSIMQQQSQQSLYSLQEQQRRHLQYSPSPVPAVHSPNPHSIPVHQGSDQPFQGQWTKKRGLYSAPEETPIQKKRNTGSEAEGLFGWSDLLAATTHSPGRQEYFDQHSSYQSNPATPPMDPGVSPLAPHFTRFQPSGYQQSPSHSSWGEPRQTERHGQFNHTDSVFGRARMDVGTSSSGGACYHSQDHISAFRSISPAPSSPSGSIDDSEEIVRMQDPNRLAASMASHVQHGGAEEQADQSRTSLAQEKRTPSGRTHFVMGFRPDCERCQRREKGHFAHFS